LRGFTSEAITELKRAGRDRAHLVIVTGSDILNFIESNDEGPTVVGAAGLGTLLARKQDQMSENASKAKAATEKPREATPPLRARGNYWEITYAEDIPQFESWHLEKTSLATDTGKTRVTVTAATRAVNLKEKEFKTCDFNHFRLTDSTFRDCKFVGCRFVKAEFNNVKFSGCLFDVCHFFHVKFINCQFLDCTFSKISASATHILFSESAISAKALVGALVTNLSSLPNA